MQTPRKKAVAMHRRRPKRRGVARLEVHVARRDVPLVRDVVAALADPERAAEARAFLRAHFKVRSTPGLKALLGAAPLDGIDLIHARDIDRAGAF